MPSMRNSMNDNGNICTSDSRMAIRLSLMVMGNSQRFTVAKTGFLMALTRPSAVLPPITIEQDGEIRELDEGEENTAGMCNTADLRATVQR